MRFPFSPAEASIEERERTRQPGRFQSVNVLTILKKIFFNDDDRDRRPPAPQASEQQEADDGLDRARLGEEKMSELEEKEDSPIPDRGAEEEQEPTQVAGTAADPMQTTPLEPLGEGRRPIQAPSLTRKKPTGEEKQDLHVIERSHVGAVRDRNEDACFTFSSQSGGHSPFPPFGLFVVADGMGGHFDGHKASEIVSRSFAGYVLDWLYLPLLRGDDGIRPPIQEVMEDAVYRANRALELPDPEKEMGTTLTAALIFGNRLFLVHVGDSRAYLLTDEEGLQPVTTDHSIVQAMKDAGQLTAEEAAVHPNRNLLYRALMGEPLEQIDIFTQSLPEQGMLVLCSDGLWGLIPDAEMEEILSAEETLPEKADKLVKEALKAGGHDNITVILVEFNL